MNFSQILSWVLQKTESQVSDESQLLNGDAEATFAASYRIRLSSIG